MEEMEDDGGACLADNVSERQESETPSEKENL